MPLFHSLVAGAEDSCHTTENIYCGHIVLAILINRYYWHPMDWFCGIFMGVRRGSKGEHLLPSEFGHLVKHLVKILTFCVIILTFGQNTNICSP